MNAIKYYITPILTFPHQGKECVMAKPSLVGRVGEGCLETRTAVERENN